MDKQYITPKWYQPYYRAWFGKKQSDWYFEFDASVKIEPVFFFILGSKSYLTKWEHSPGRQISDGDCVLLSRTNIQLGKAQLPQHQF